MPNVTILWLPRRGGSGHDLSVRYVGVCVLTLLFFAAVVLNVLAGFFGLNQSRMCLLSGIRINVGVLTLLVELSFRRTGRWVFFRDDAWVVRRVVDSCIYSGPPFLEGGCVRSSWSHSERS